MKNGTKITIIVLLAIGILLGGYFFLKSQQKTTTASLLTREQMQSILLAGNKISGADIEAMTDAQLLAAIQAGGYKLTV